MLLLSAERAFHRSCSNPGKLPLDSILYLVLAYSTLLSKGGLDAVLLAESSIVVSGIPLVTTDLLHRHSSQFL